MTDLWESVPQVRWTGSRPDASLPQDSEPSVAANTAASISQSQVAPLSSATSENQLLGGPATAPNDIASVQQTGGVDSPTYESTSGNATTRSDPATASAEYAVGEQGQGQIQRLKAALDDDAERVQGSPGQTGSVHDVRVRVDSMLEKASRLFDLGQLREARQAAKVAHDLSDSARLDYSPDEERPIDLVQRIEDRMKEATEQADKLEASPTTADAELAPSNEPASASIRPSIPMVEGKSPPFTKSGELEPSARTRKDWTQGLSVFRRDRKAIPIASPTVPKTESSAIPLGLETGAEISESNDGAIVQANRSLSLSTSGRPNSSIERQSEFPTNGSESSEQSGDIVPPILEEVKRTQPVLAIAAATWKDDFTTPRKLKIEEPTSAPVDFDEVEPVSRFRDVAGQSAGPTTSVTTVDSPGARDRSWEIGIALFAVCTIIATFWYRRGAI